jgi:chorismate mutase
MTDIDTTLAKFQLNQFRDSIDNLDAILVHTLAERFKLTQQVGKLKAQHNLPPADKAREAEQIERLRHGAGVRPRPGLCREIPQFHRGGSDPPS